MKKIPLKYYYFAIVSLLIIIYVGYKFFRTESLYENGKIVNGIVYQVNKGSSKGGNIVIKYYFYFKGKKYSGGIDSGLKYVVSNEILNASFPVLVDSLNPDNNIILVDVERWEKIGVAFPDSLEWIKKYYPADLF